MKFVLVITVLFATAFAATPINDISCNVMGASAPTLGNGAQSLIAEMEKYGTDSTAIVCQAVQGGIGTIGTVLTPLTGQDFPDMPCAQVGSTWDEIQNNAENLKANADAIALAGGEVPEANCNGMKSALTGLLKQGQ